MQPWCIRTTPSSFMSPVIHRRSDDTTRAMGEIAELALSCDDQAAFRDWLLERLDQLIGFDLASLHSVRAPRQASMRVRGYDADLVAERLFGYMLEFEPGELAAAVRGRPLVDTEVLSRRRREQLSLYREQLLPHGVSVMMTTMWRDHHAGFGFHLARCGRGRTFHRDEIQTLAARGLQNREIATMLGVSSLTVRNQLGAVFRKADVTNRSELAFVCASPPGDRNAPNGGAAWTDFFRSSSHR